ANDSRSGRRDCRTSSPGLVASEAILSRPGGQITTTVTQSDIRHITLRGRSHGSGTVERRVRGAPLWTRARSSPLARPRPPRHRGADGGAVEAVAGEEGAGPARRPRCTT